ncbi:MAG TPA: UvrD-helicase domain-containing protein [Gemmatimonadales bacterium]|nr:UvrD-helicase domain-containing protein [Gemmatimonadales bacterium]
MIESLNQNLNPVQRQAVEHVDGPLLVVAGAGSGKTRVLTARIAHLIAAHGVTPTRIFAVTFTNKAAQEMKRRVGRLLGRNPAGLWIGTFHALSARLLRREAHLLGFSRNFTIYDEDDRVSLIRRLMKERNLDAKTFSPRAVQSIISGAKNEMIEPRALEESAGFDRLVAVAAQVYHALGPALKAANAMDFDDLLIHPLTVFRQHPERLKIYQEGFRFILVDEFQDTNRAQYDLVRLLGADGNVCAVGDDDQSIYGWRGAKVQNMLDFQTDFDGTTVVRLEENYRSTQLILDAANHVIADNVGRLGKTLFTRRGGGEAVTVVAAADERDEAEWLVRELGERAQTGSWAYDEMAILYRTNAQSRAFEEALRRAGTPYKLIGAVSFYERREVKDLLAYLRLVANPADDEAFLRAIAVPRRGLGPSSLITLGHQATQWNKSLLDTAAIADRVAGLRPQARRGLLDFAALIQRLRDEAGTLPPAAILELLIAAIDYEAVLEAEGVEGVERWDNVRELVASAAAWSEVLEDDAAASDGEQHGTMLERFLAEAALFSAHDTVIGDQAGLTLMTLHTAKGLEWPVVALAGMEDGLFPLGRAEEQPGGLEEERRLCYVGLTRAKDKLYLTWAKRRRRGGEFRPGRVSRFLRALPPDLTEERRTSSFWEPARRFGARRSWTEQGSWQESVPAVEVESQVAPRYLRGERVHHRQFGSGTIQGLQGTGKGLRVSVAFDDESVGTKQLLVAYAGLEREWEGA